MWPSYAGSRLGGSSIIGVNTRMPCATPIRLTPTTHSQSRGVCSQISPPAPTPALLKTRCGAPKRRPRRGAERLDLGGLRDVEPERQHLGAERLDLGRGAVERVLLHVGHHDVHAAPRGEARGLEAEARAGAGDDGRAAV